MRHNKWPHHIPRRLTGRRHANALTPGLGVLPASTIRRCGVTLNRAVRAGTTDLGGGAVVAFHPEAWPAAETSRLLQSLQVLHPCAEIRPDCAQLMPACDRGLSEWHLRFHGHETVNICNKTVSITRHMIGQRHIAARPDRLTLTLTLIGSLAAQHPDSYTLRRRRWPGNPARCG